MSRVTLEDGRVFPSYEGKALAWNFTLYNSREEEQQGYPRAKAVLRELNADQLIAEYKGRLRDSFDRIFGPIARPMLALVEAEMKRRKGAMA